MFKHKNSYDVQEIADKNKAEITNLKIAVVYHSLSADIQNEIDIKLQNTPRDSFKINNKQIEDSIKKDLTPKCLINLSSAKIKSKEFEKKDLKITEKIKGPEKLIDDHIITMDSFLVKYQVNKSSGLTEEQVKFIRQRDGINELRKKRKQPGIIKYVKELFCG